MYQKLLIILTLFFTVIANQFLNTPVTTKNTTTLKNQHHQKKFTPNTDSEHVFRILQSINQQNTTQNSQNHNTTQQNNQSMTATLPPEPQKPTLPKIQNQKIQNSQKNQNQKQQNPTIPEIPTQQEEDSEHQNLTQSELNDRFGGLSKQFLSILNPGGENLDNSLVNKLMQRLGLVDAKQIKDQYDVTKLEEGMRFRQEKQFGELLSNWVRQEKDSSKQIRDRMLTQGEIFQKFQFQLESSQSRRFYMNVSAQRPQNYTFHIIIYWQVENNYLPPNSPSQQSFLAVNLIKDGQKLMQKKVYVESTFEWKQFREDGRVQVSFQNNVPHKLIVLVNLQKLPIIPATSPKEAEIDPISFKLEEIVKSFKKNHTEAVYRTKAQIGFKQNGLRHMNQYLILSFVEMAVIVLTVVLQIYYLKRLIGNNVIMV